MTGGVCQTPPQKKNTTCMTQGSSQKTTDQQMIGGVCQTPSQKQNTTRVTEDSNQTTTDQQTKIGGVCPKSTLLHKQNSLTQILNLEPEQTSTRPLDTPIQDGNRTVVEVQIHHQDNYSPPQHTNNRTNVLQNSGIHEFNVPDTEKYTLFHQPIKCKTQFTILHQNTDRIANKIDRMNSLLEIQKPDVLIVTEHSKNKETLLNTRLIGYTLISDYSRKQHLKGGVAIYTKEHLKENSEAIITIEDLSIEMVCEVAAVKLKVGKSIFIVVGIYRPDNNLESDLEVL
ncbi:hypothetical protein J6590_091433, partial [Homalodisca vitripennis]